MTEMGKKEIGLSECVSERVKYIPAVFISFSVSQTVWGCWFRPYGLGLFVLKSATIKRDAK